VRVPGRLYRHHAGTMLDSAISSGVGRVKCGPKDMLAWCIYISGLRLGQGVVCRSVWTSGERVVFSLDFTYISSTMQCERCAYCHLPIAELGIDKFRRCGT